MDMMIEKPLLGIMWYTESASQLSFDGSKSAPIPRLRYPLRIDDMIEILNRCPPLTLLTS